MIEDTRMLWLRSQMDLNLPSRTILPSKLQNNTRTIGGKKFIALLFSALNCTWKRRPSISVKIFMFFLSLETSTVAFRTVLDELLCFFFALNLTSFWYFFRNLSFLLSCLLFGENLPRKFPQNSREISRFLREFVSSNPAKFHFFSRELSEALPMTTTRASPCSQGRKRHDDNVWHIVTPPLWKILATPLVPLQHVNHNSKLYPAVYPGGGNNFDASVWPIHQNSRRKYEKIWRVLQHMLHKKKPV